MPYRSGKQGTFHPSLTVEEYLINHSAHPRPHRVHLFRYVQIVKTHIFLLSVPCIACMVALLVAVIVSCVTFNLKGPPLLLTGQQAKGFLNSVCSVEGSFLPGCYAEALPSYLEVFAIPPTIVESGLYASSRRARHHSSMSIARSFVRPHNCAGTSVDWQ